MPPLGPVNGEKVLEGESGGGGEGRKYVLHVVGDNFFMDDARYGALMNSHPPLCSCALGWGRRDEPMDPPPTPRVSAEQVVVSTWCNRCGAGGRG